MPRTELIVTHPKPTLLERVRSYWSGPLTAKSPELARWWGGTPTATGISVTEESAMTVSAVWSAVTMISDDIASLPLNLYKRLPTGGKDKFESHPLYRLLHDAPNPEMDSMVLRRTMQAHALLWQNAYAEIERDAAGRPVAMWPLMPECVRLERGVNGRLRYIVHNPSGSEVVIDPEDMIHLVGYSHDGSTGSSLVKQARESLSLGLAAERFGGSFFGNGATFGGVISYKGPRPPEMSEENYRKALEARHQGVDRAHKLLALYNDASYTRMGIPPNEAQFLETRVFQIREVARWFKIPPHKLADLADATFSNVEQQNLDYYSSCLRPWLVLWQQQLSRKLIAKLERSQQFIEHDTHGFLAADAAGRAAQYSAEFQVAALTPNEIRGYENRDPLTGGDRSFIQMQYIPLDRYDEWLDAEIASKKEKALPPPPPPPSNDDELKALRAAVLAHEAAIAMAHEHLHKAEQRADDLSLAREEQERRVDNADAMLSQTIELLDGAKSALDTATREHEIARIALEEQVAAATEREAAEHRRYLQEVTDHAATTTRAAESQRAHEEATMRADTAEEASRTSAETLARRQAEHVAEIDRLTADLTSVRGERDDAQAARDVAIADAAAARAEKLASEHRADEADRARVVAEEARAAADTVHVAELADVLGQLEDAMTQRDQARAAQMAADAARIAAELRAEQADRDKAIAEQAQQAATALAEEIRQREIARAGAVITAHRALLVEAMGRMVRWETEKADRHKTTPQKLRAWIDTFYIGHLETIQRTLEPIVSAHLAWLQSDADPAMVAKEMAEAHVEESVTQLRNVLAVEDFAPTFAKMLTRWEQRPEMLANRLVHEGVAHVRSL